MHRRWIIGTGFAIILHWLTLFVFAAELVPQTTKRPDAFYFHHGGDNYAYFNQAMAMQSGTVIESKYPLGFSMLIVPVLPFTDPDTHDYVAQIIAFLWSVVLYPVGLIILARITYLLTRCNDMTLIATIFYAAMPLLTFLSLNLIWNAEMAEINTTHMMWAQMLSDGPTAFFTMLAAWLMLVARQHDYKLRYVFLVGIVAGILVLLRFSAVLVVAVIGLLFLFERKFVAGILLGIVALAVYSPQMIYNQHFFGDILTTGYTALDELPVYGLFDSRYLSEALTKFSERLGIFSILIGFFATASLLWVLRWLWQKSPAGVWLIGGWLLSYIAFYSVYYYSWTGAFLRFMIPALPAIAIIG
ncbi:MAG: hypothetical protein ACPG7F_20175, partial [Aggregatilineales bacterium]